MLIINTLKEFSKFIWESYPMARDLINSQALDNEEFGNMSVKDAYQSACDEYIEMYVDPNEVQINLDKQTCSDWLWEHAS